jgi:hypothetical protein
VGFDAMLFSKWFPTLLRIVSPSSKMLADEGKLSVRTSGTADPTIQLRTPGDFKPQTNLCENINAQLSRLLSSGM